MSSVALRRLLTPRSPARALVTTLSEALRADVLVEDVEGRRLHGDTAEAAQATRAAVIHDGAPIGWVSGNAQATTVATLLSHLAGHEGERRALGAEVLHLYREVNLIYSFSEKLAAQLDVDRVAELTLSEARQLIAATDGVVALLDDVQTLTTVASFGSALSNLPPFARGDGILGAVAASGHGEMVNDVAADPRLVSSTPIAALVCAPLKVGERVIGLLALGSQQPCEYAAADLKLLTTLGLQAATAIESARLFERSMQAARERERLTALHQAAELARTRLEGELTVAARIQADLFPNPLASVAGYELAARNRPARRCGGDYFDVVTRDASHDGSPRLLLCVADVAGKGLPAALVMSNMQATLRALAATGASLPALASRAGELLFAATAPEKYVTAAFAELEPGTGAVTFLGAGHLDNVILRRNGDVERLASSGPPLGLLPPEFPVDAALTGHEARLDPGDTLVLFSDGLTDAQDADGEEYGEARLHALLHEVRAEPPDTLIDRLLASIDAFVQGAPQFDDMTVLVARRR